MSENNNIQGLFDVSGNLTIQAMDRYISGGLSKEEMELVQRHLDENPFDREAVEGLQKHYSAQSLPEIEELKKSVILATGKLPETGKRLSATRTYWYAAAGLILLLGVSVFMVLMFRTPLNKTELAVLQPDTIISMPTATATATAPVVAQEDQKQSVSENDIIPLSPQVKQIDVVEDDLQFEEKELAAEPEVVINDDVLVEADFVAEDNFVGGIQALDETIIEVYPITKEMVAPESSRAMSKMAQDSEAEMAEESQIFMVVEEMPVFPGGEEALYKYLGENITYPQMAKEGGVQGRVFVTFVVESDGTISDVRVLRGIGGGCDEEALRVVKAMPEWVPGSQRGKPVRVQYNLAVKFSLE